MNYSENVKETDIWRYGTLVREFVANDARMEKGWVNGGSVGG